MKLRISDKPEVGEEVISLSLVKGSSGTVRVISRSSLDDMAIVEAVFFEDGHVSLIGGRRFK